MKNKFDLIIVLVCLLCVVQYDAKALKLTKQTQSLPGKKC